MVKFFFLINFIFPLVIYSQFNERTVIQDFNYDGIKDTLHTHYDGGSSFGGTYAKMINGKTNKSFVIDLFHSYAEIKNVIIIPEHYYEKGNNLFINAMLKEVFPKKREKPEKSLQWILNSQFHKKDSINSLYFSEIFNPNSNWSKERIEVPNSYYININQDTLKRMEPRSPGSGDLLKIEKHKGFLLYGSAVLKQNRKHKKGFKIIASSGKYKIYASDHGMYVQKKELYKWLFINDTDIVGGPQKLRWKSIKSVRIVDDFLVLEQNATPDIIHNLLLIDIKTGIVAKLKFEFTDEDRFNMDKYSKIAMIKKKHIILRDYERIKKIYFKDLFKEFEKISKLVITN